MSEQYQHIPGVFQKVVNFLGGIAGVTAGISTVLSVLGYLLLYAHADLLGLSDVFHHTVGNYLYKGGAFFIGTFFWAVPAVIIGNPYGWMLIAVIALYVLAKRLGGGGRIKKQLNPEESLQQSWARWVLLLVAAFLLLIFIRHSLLSFKATDLLFLASHHPEIVKRTTSEGVQELQDQYVYSMLYCMLAVLIVWGVNHIHRDPEKKSPLAWLYLFGRSSASPAAPAEEKSPKKTGELLSVVGCLFLYLLFMIQVLLLPLQYGRTIYPNTFHRVTEVILDEKLQGRIPRSENVWLLNERTGGELVFYFKDTQEVVLVPQKHILSFKVKARENIFAQ